MSTIFLPDQELPEDCTVPIYRGSLENWSGKIFGELHDVDVDSTGVRLLASKRGFSVWFPPNVWQKFDVQVNDFLSMVGNENSECWLATGKFAFIKIDIDPTDMDDPLLKTGDPAEYLRYAHRFLEANFKNNSRCYPDSEWNTIGYRRKDPGAPVPFRVRLGGNFRLQFP